MVGSQKASWWAEVCRDRSRQVGIPQREKTKECDVQVAGKGRRSATRSRTKERGVVLVGKVEERSQYGGVEIQKA